jgi:hypothetical protein
LLKKAGFFTNQTATLQTETDAESVQNFSVGFSNIAREFFGMVAGDS